MMQKRILVVDDEADFVKSVSDRLAFEGYEVTTACDSEMAIATVRAGPPDLILLDVMMPGRSGVELYKELRDSPDTASIPVIFVTVWQGALDDAGIGDTGGWRLVRKPFDFEMLLREIKTALG